MSRPGSAGVRAVVIDIEGTVSPLNLVRDQLFPYARQRIGQWVCRAEPAVEEVVQQVRTLAGLPAADLGEVGEVLCRWADEDRKVAPLKTLQGLIWAAGFAAGELTSEVYDDVPAALRSWSGAGLPLYVYSSGSVLAQRLWFANTRHGDLGGLFSGHFDLTSAGPKREPASYQAIGRQLGLAPAATVYLSDLRAELDAAAAAGWQPVGVRRPGNDGDLGRHPVVASLAELALGGAVVRR